MPFDMDGFIKGAQRLQDVSQKPAPKRKRKSAAKRIEVEPEIKEEEQEEETIDCGLIENGQYYDCKEGKIKQMPIQPRGNNV